MAPTEPKCTSLPIMNARPHGTFAVIPRKVMKP
jgi:hypothetical protein